jgi:hypothetical protein
VGWIFNCYDYRHLLKKNHLYSICKLMDAEMLAVATQIYLVFILKWCYMLHDCIIDPWLSKMIYPWLHLNCVLFLYFHLLYLQLARKVVYSAGLLLFFVRNWNRSGFDNAWLSLTVFSHVNSCVWIVLQICAHPGERVLIYRIFVGTGCSGGYAYVHKAWLHNLCCEGNLATFQFQNFESS